MATEKRLIDANEVIRQLEQDKELFLDGWGGFSSLPPKDKARVDELGNCISRLFNAPTVDAVEVVHGRWEDMSDKFDICMDLRCSVCHRRASNFVGGSEDWWDMWKPNFCPNCGADMRERKDNG